MVVGNCLNQLWRFIRVCRWRWRKAHVGNCGNRCRVPCHRQDGPKLSGCRRWLRGLHGLHVGSYILRRTRRITRHMNDRNSAWVKQSPSCALRLIFHLMKRVWLHCRMISRGAGSNLHTLGGHQMVSVYMCCDRVLCLGMWSSCDGNLLFMSL